MSKDIVVVGSLAYDSVSTPSGKADKALGGSANYFSVSASLLSPVKVVGVVGSDYSDQDMSILKSRNVDTDGVQVVDGKTFHWEGKYEGDLNEAITLATELNVFEDFKPNLPESYRSSDFLFLANIDPEIQLDVLSQVQKPSLVACDTMNFWIETKRDKFVEVLNKVDVLLINETESTMLTKTANAIEAAEAICKMGPKAVVIKRGEYGFMLYCDNQFFVLPAFPIGKVVDPTGAGDTFAGGFMGYLASHDGELDETAFRKACVHGTIMASFTVQDFSLGSIASLERKAFDSRLKDYMGVVAIPQ